LETEEREIRSDEHSSTDGAELEATATNEKPKTYLELIKVWNGRLTDRSMIQAVLQPFPLFLFPSVLFSVVISGAFSTWLAISSLVSGQILFYPPYSLAPDKIVYIGLPGSFVGLFSAMFAGWFSDRLIKYLAHHNKGIYEPEYRLLMMIPAIFFSTIGFFMMGPAYTRHDSVLHLVIISQVFYIAGPFASLAGYTYILDTQPKNVPEAIVAISLTRSLFIFFTNQYVPKWFAKVGPTVGYQTLGVLNICFGLLTIPMYIYGKRLRGMVSPLAYMCTICFFFMLFLALLTMSLLTWEHRWHVAISLPKPQLWLKLGNFTPIFILVHTFLDARHEQLRRRPLELPVPGGGTTKSTALIVNMMPLEILDRV
jgi:hypothetical protein